LHSQQKKETKAALDAKEQGNSLLDFWVNINSRFSALA